MIHAETLAELVEQASREYAERPAYTWRPGLRALRFTYGDIGRLARRAAALLDREGVQPGDRLLLWAVNSPYWVAAFFGCQLRGIVPVPLMAQNTPDFVEKIARITDAKLILKSSLRPVRVPGVPILSLEASLASDGVPDAFTPALPGPDDACQILFTSGTTGTPKGVVLKHRNILANVEDIVAARIVVPGDHLMSFLPLAHAFEQVCSLFTAMTLGLQVTQAASLSGPHIRLCMEEDHPTVLVSVPEFLKLAMQQVEAKAAERGQGEKLAKLFALGPKLPVFARRRLARPILERFGGRLRLAVVGGSALDPDVGARWEALGVTVLQGYGATECSPVVAANRPGRHKLASVGPPLDSVQVRLAEDGELLVKGPNVVDGYYQRPDETAARFRDGWYYTDDLGEIDSDGHVRIRGRKKFLIVTPAGENVYPEDVEAELAREPEVRDAAVLGWRRNGRFEIHAVLLPRPEARGADMQPVVERANRRLQPHQRIQGVSVWDDDDFPRTTTRKVRKNEVLAWLNARESPEEAPDLSVPVGAVERAIALAAGVPAATIRPEMRLEADLKLDSLGRVTLLGAIEEELGVVLDEGQVGPETRVEEIRRLVHRREQKEERWEFNPRPLGPRAHFVRRVGQALFAWPLLGWYGPMRVEGRERLRDLQGPVLFLPNHTSPVDAGYVVKALPPRFRARSAVAAATDVLYGHPSVKRFSRLVEVLMNTFPFDREGQVKSAMQYTGRMLDRGYSIVLYPEGRMSMTGELLEIKGGAGILAVEMGVPVVPMRTFGIDKIVPPTADRVIRPRRSRVRVVFGAPLRFPPGYGYDRAAQAIGAALAALGEE